MLQGTNSHSDESKAIQSPIRCRRKKHILPSEFSLALGILQRDKLSGSLTPLLLSNTFTDSTTRFISQDINRKCTDKHNHTFADRVAQYKLQVIDQRYLQHKA